MEDHGSNTPAPLTFAYRMLRGVFTAGLKGFYNTVEVINSIFCSNYRALRVCVGCLY